MSASRCRRARWRGAPRLDNFKFQFFQQTPGLPGAKVTTDMPGIINIRQDPFEDAVHQFGKPE